MAIEDDLPFTPVDDHLETKEDILLSAFNDWSNSNHLITPYVIRDMRLAFEAGAEWAVLK